MITYPVSQDDRFVFFDNTTDTIILKPGQTEPVPIKWPRADGQPLVNAPSHVSPAILVVLPKPAFDPDTHKLVRAGTLFPAEQEFRVSFTVTALTQAELDIIAARKANEQKRLNLEQSVATLRTWATQAQSTTVTSGNAVATLQTIVDRMGVFFDRFADMIEINNPAP